VTLVQQPEWINTVSYIPLLRYSVLASLLSEYVPDGVGISPTTLHVSKVFSQQQQQQLSGTVKKDGGNNKVVQNGVFLALICPVFFILFVCCV